MMMMSATIQAPTRPSVADDPRWARIVARDRTADGHLWYSVETTGVYCRPSCPSRIANPRNVQLHDTLESARATGFRPCKRCNPDGLSKDRKNAALVARACRIIEESEEEPSLDRSGGGGRAQSGPLPSPVQGDDGPDAEAICRRRPGEEGPPRTGWRQHRDGGDL